MISVGNTANSGVLAAASSTTFSLNNNKQDVVVLVAIRDAATTATATVTYNGEAMTEDKMQFFDDPDGANDLRAYVFRKTGAATGANDVVVTFSSSVDHAGVWAVAVDGLDSSGQPDATNGDGKNNSAGLDPSITLTTIDANTIIFGVVYSKHDAGGGSFTAASGSTSVGQLNVNGGGDRAMANYKIVSSPGSNTISWTGNGAYDDWVYAAAAYKQAAAATGRLFRTPILNGLAGVGQQLFNPTLTGV